MSVKSLPMISSVAGRPRKSREVTALVSMRPLSDDELQGLLRAAAAQGLNDLRAARIRLAPHDAEAIADPPVPETDLSRALAEARQRGGIVRRDLLDDMFSTADLADLLGMSQEGVRQKLKRHELLGLALVKRGIRYPKWQILEDGRLLPHLSALFAVLGPDPWRIYRFLIQHHPELDGATALEALRAGRIDAVTAAADSVVSGSFA